MTDDATPQQNAPARAPWLSISSGMLTGCSTPVLMAGLGLGWVARNLWQMGERESIYALGPALLLAFAAGALVLVGAGGLVMGTLGLITGRATKT